jgi:hypothetical protein
MNNDKFKNAPIHDKKAIIDMMDELEPKDMIEVVELLKSKQEKVVYEVDFGEEAHGEVRLINGLYRCFVTPQYGGDWQEIGAGYHNIEKAIEHIESWT